MVYLVEGDVQQLRAAVEARVLLDDDAVRVLEEVDDDVAPATGNASASSASVALNSRKKQQHALVAGHAPFWSRRRIEDETSVLALDAGADAVAEQRVRAGGMRALVAAHALLHVGEWRVVVAEWTQDVTLQEQCQLSLLTVARRFSAVRCLLS